MLIHYLIVYGGLVLVLGMSLILIRKIWRDQGSSQIDNVNMILEELAGIARARGIRAPTTAQLLEISRQVVDPYRGGPGIPGERRSELLSDPGRFFGLEKQAQGWEAASWPNFSP